MKHFVLTISQETKTTVADVVRWTQELDRLHARLAPRFARPEPRRRALAFLHGILSTTSRKNGWQLAEHAREARPDGMQRLLASAVWDTDGVRDESLARTPLSILVSSPPLPSSTKRVFQNKGRSRQASECSIAEPLDRSRIVRWASFSPMSQPRGIRSLTANFICPWTGQRTVIGVKPLVFQTQFASRRNRNWPDACWRVFGMPRSRLLG